MSAKITQSSSEFGADTPTPLFQAHLASFLPSYDVSADGQRFLTVTALPENRPSPINVVVNWDAEGKTQ
jgi:hypothetical protein